MTHGPVSYIFWRFNDSIHRIKAGLCCTDPTVIRLKTSPFTVGSVQCVGKILFMMFNVRDGVGGSCIAVESGHGSVWVSPTRLQPDSFG